MQTFNQYQEFTKSLAAYNEEVYYKLDDGTTIRAPWTYPATALSEEAGEVAGKIAKFIRKKHDDVSELRLAIAKELGDCLYQLSETARQFGYTLQEIAELNYAKLNDRKDRGVLIGEGDNR